MAHIALLFSLVTAVKMNNKISPVNLLFRASNPIRRLDVVKVSLKAGQTSNQYGQSFLSDSSTFGTSRVRIRSRTLDCLSLMINVK